MAQVWKWIAAVLAAAPMAGPTGAQSREPVASGLYCGRDLGHWFYCSRPAPEPDAQREEAVSPAAAIRATREQTLQDAKAYVAELEHARLIAAYSPTPENVRYYQELQYDATERAAVYTDHWRRNVWSDASLDYTTRRPMAQFANHTFVDERAAEMTTDLANLSDQYGLFYFYRSDCPYCAVSRIGMAWRFARSPWTAAPCRTSRTPRPIEVNSHVSLRGVSPSSRRSCCSIQKRARRTGLPSA